MKKTTEEVDKVVSTALEVLTAADLDRHIVLTIGQQTLGIHVSPTVNPLLAIEALMAAAASIRTILETPILPKGPKLTLHHGGQGTA